jgi:hypothetical protein
MHYDNGDMPASDDMAQCLLQAVRAQNFRHTADGWAGGAPIARFPDIGLVRVSFAPARAPVRADVHRIVETRV